MALGMERCYGGNATVASGATTWFPLASGNGALR